MIGYKYRGGYNFNRDLDSIAGDYFFAASLDKLNDPFEATYSTAPIEEFMRLLKLLAGQDPSLRRVQEQLQQVLGKMAGTGIFSLAARFDDLKLWAHYADSYKGFCVGYDVGMLEKFNGQVHYSHNLINVNYAEKPEALDFDDIRGGIIPFMQKVLGTKHPEWAHEAETRIITDVAGKMPHDFRAIKSIHFGLHMPQAQMEEMMQRMQGRGIAYYKMERRPAAYGLKAVPVVDPFMNAPRYLYQVASIFDESVALDTYAEGKEKEDLLPYLHKALEIQRRDPYCSKVYYAERCTDEKRSGQIFVHYSYNEQYYNQYFTKPEIERLYAKITDLTD